MNAKSNYNPAAKKRAGSSNGTKSMVQCWALGALSLVAVLATSPAAYADGANVMRVEEDWEVVLNDPGEFIDAPQFHTVIALDPGLDSFYMQVSWNYRGLTEFTPGGMQLQAWYGEFQSGNKSYREDRLSTHAETISWTQTMRTNGSTLTFRIENGSSTTWGMFGGSDTSLSGNVAVPHLNAYSTNTSVFNSWITYGSNRVNILQIKEVRRYDADGHLLSRDTTPKVVFQLQEN